MTDTGALYAQVRGRIGELVRDLDEQGAATVVPTCPEWTVRDLVAHLTGVCADILGGRMDGVGSEAWTQRQVDERRDKSLVQIVDEWNEVAPQVEAIAEHFPNGADVQWVMDCVTHEHDIRCALGRPGARDDEAIARAVPWLTGALANLPAFEGDGADAPAAFRIVTPEGDDLVMGVGEPEVTVRLPRFEVFRALTGRRSAGQIASYDWDGDHGRYLGAFSQGPFTIAASDVVE